jgi:hypothetical protein
MSLKLLMIDVSWPMRSSVKGIFIYGLLVGVFLSWLFMAGIWIVALRRMGSSWSRDLRLWTRLRVLEYAWLLLLVTAMLLGVGDWIVLPMLIAFVALLVLRWVIRRRMPQWPPQFDQPS